MGGNGAASITAVGTPRAASAAASVAPTGPAPMTATTTSRPAGEDALMTGSLGHSAAPAEHPPNCDSERGYRPCSRKADLGAFALLRMLRKRAFPAGCPENPGASSLARDLNEG